MFLTNFDVSTNPNSEALRIAFVGGGASNTFALLRLLKYLKSAADHQLLDRLCQFPKIEIVFLNADDNFATGIAYGKIHPIFLLNTPIRMLEPCREFEQWFMDSKSWVISKLVSMAENENAGWLKDLRLQLERADISEVNLPRVIYGAFLREEFQKSFSLVESINTVCTTRIEITVLKARIDKIKKKEDIFRLSVRNQKVKVTSSHRHEDGDIVFLTKDIENMAKDHIDADIVSFGIGFERNSYSNLCGVQGYFPSVYEPGVDVIRDWIISHPARIVEVAILGTKSAALDFIRYVSYTPDILQKVRIKAISLSGQTRYPDKISVDKPGYLPLLVSNRINKITTTDELLELIEEEISLGQSHGYTRLDICRSVLKGKYQELARQKFNNKEKRKLDREGNRRIRDLFSFTDSDSVEAFHKLRKKGILCPERGRVSSIDYKSGNGRPFVINTTCDGASKKTAVDAVINCTGAARLRNCRSPVLKSVLDENLASINESGVGLKVSSTREASPNFFVVGPLTSGGEIGDRKGRIRYQPIRHTLPYILEDADIVGEAIARHIIQA